MKASKEHLIQLRKLLTTRLDESDLRNLCFDLEIDYENLAGNSKADKVRELLLFVKNRDRESELVHTCKELRPDIEWGIFSDRNSIDNHQVLINHLKSEGKFWHWFKKNSVRISNLIDNVSKDNFAKTAQEATLAELHDELSKVAQGLTYQIGAAEHEGWELVISADGNRNLFPHVIKLVGSAPLLEKWKIVAFRQPTSLDIELTADNKILSPKQIWFYAIPNLDKLDLLIFVEHFSDIDENFIIMAIFVLLDAALGEYDVETVIGRLEFHELPEHPKELHLKPFVELPKFVDSWKTLMEY